MDAIAKFDYDKQQDDELNLRVGQRLTNVVQVEEGWCQGTLNGVTGMFPDNFVEITTTPSKPKPPPPVSAKKQRRAKVAFSYAADNDDELSLQLGQIVDIIDEVEEGWWKGSCEGREGVFPSNFVEIIEDDEVTPQQEKTAGANEIPRTSSMLNAMPGLIGVDPNELKRKLKSVNSPSTSAAPPTRPQEKSQPPPPSNIPSGPPPGPSPGPSSGGLRRAKVMFKYDADNPDEVSVKEGDVVEVLQFEDETGQEGWWSVRTKDNVVGLVPDNFVELLPQTAEPATQPAQPILPEKLPQLPTKTPEVASEKPRAPVGGIRLMPSGGMPPKMRSNTTTPALPPKTEQTDRSSDDLDIPRADMLDNRKVKDRPKMNPRRPPSRSGLTEEEDSKPPPPTAPAKAPWQQEMEKKKAKPPPPVKQKPKPASKPFAPAPAPVDKEEETPKKPVPPPAAVSSSVGPSPRPHPPAATTSSNRPITPTSKSTTTQEDKVDSGAWKAAIDKLQKEFDKFRQDIQEEMAMLVDDLDKERKKRAELEIDIDRLKRSREFREKHH